MKWLIALLVLGVGGAAGAYYYLYRQSMVAAQAATDHARAQREIDVCRDLCEQNAIVYARSEEDMRACRARCDGKVERPYVPIRSISVAPADHRAPPAQPPPRTERFPTRYPVPKAKQPPATP